MAWSLTYPSCWIHQLVCIPPIRLRISTYSPAVLVGQVKRIPRELGTAAGCALDGQGAVVACSFVNSVVEILELRCVRVISQTRGAGTIADILACGMAVWSNSVS